MKRLDSSELRVVKMVAPVRQQLVETLRKAIIGFRFKPGEKLIERELCEMTNVSRTALREGLRQLEAEGLIEIVPHKGPMVARVGLKQAQNIYEVRALLEGFMGRCAAERATTADIKALRKSLDRIRKVLTSRDRLGIIAAKGEFYAILLRITDNDELTGILHKYFGQLSLLWPTMIVQSSEAEGSIDEISDIIDAIERRDPTGAETAFRVHMENASRLTCEFMESGNWEDDKS